MNLQEALGGRAIHISGRFLLDAPEAVRRYWRIWNYQKEDGDVTEAESYVAVASADPPEDFPQDGWIPLASGR